MSFEAQCDCYYDSPGARGTMGDWTEYALRMKSGSIERDHTIRALESQLAALKAELQAKTAEVEKLRTRWWAVVAGFNTYQIEQHELNCDERDHEVAIFDRIGDIIFYAPDPHPSQGGGE